jgi:hypothetical protein
MKKSYLTVVLTLTCLLGLRGGARAEGSCTLARTMQEPMCARLSLCQRKT